MPSRSRVLVASMALLVGSIAGEALADEPNARALDVRFAETVRPFLKTYCLGCHGAKKQEGKLDLSEFSSATTVVARFKTWEIVLERLEAAEMPPEEAKRLPPANERGAVVAWIKALREREALKNAGDPGPVLARRLSNAEYDNSIRDLTGADIRPTREFPVDPANEAGFDNSGESLTMSPALLKKYYEAARTVAEHIVFTPDGFAFAPHPAVTDVDRDKYCVKRIIDFYQKQKIDYADYFLAAWRFHRREVLGKKDATLETIAAESGLSAKYLRTVAAVLNEPQAEFGPLRELRELWRKLPDDLGKAEQARKDCERMRDLVIRRRKEFPPKADTLRAPGISRGSQPLVLWRNRLQAENRMRCFDFSATLTREEAADPRSKEALEIFCRVFPDAFFVSDRGPYFNPKAAGQGRPLTAGFHLMQGYFRDDEPLRELILDDAKRRELDDLWRELDFITGVPARQYKDFIFFERAEPPHFMKAAEFDGYRSEDKDASSPTKLQSLGVLYLAEAKKKGANEEALKAIETYFSDMSNAIRRVEEDRRIAEPSRLKAALKFAERAYRRPLSKDEADRLLAYYRESRENDGLSHEDAIRDLVTTILLSPNFCYLFDPAEPGASPKPLSDFALASRLSYFLWSSLPDDDLLTHAAAGDLRRPEVLLAQTRRMLRDDRIRALAVEFGGNWLDFRRFEEHNGVDRERFPSFTNELRQAMYEEPIRFFVDVIRRDRSVLDFLDADDTFVNPVLAKHYGMPVPNLGPDEWVRVPNARRYGRGGLPPMSVFLTANSPGLRTSPVKRGYWVVRRLLGERIPPPPPKVPELPKDEASAGDLSLPQLLARHRADKSCAGCHQRFDSVGLVFEGYGPIGELRDRDLGGRPIVAKATFPDGGEGTGIDGLRGYLSLRRRQDFVDTLCRKLLIYALGRGLLPSDETTAQAMRDRLATDDNRFDGLIETIVVSPQFRLKRGKDDPRSH